MPDWSYRTFLRRIMLSLGAERSRRLATTALGTLARIPFGLATIEFLGHMRADPRLRRRLGTVELSGPIALGALIDPSGKATGAFAQFGAGLIEIGPVGEVGTERRPEWRIDLRGRTVTASSEIVSSVDEVEANLRNVSSRVPICVRISAGDAQTTRRIGSRLQNHAAMFTVDLANVAAVRDLKPTLARIAAESADVAAMARAASEAGAAGVWIYGSSTIEQVRDVRAALPGDAIVIPGSATEPEDVRRLLDAGADVVAIDAGLICNGPGLVKRCNEALLSALTPTAEPEPLTIDAARRAWFWAFLLGLSMTAGGLLAILIASQGVVLPYDESLSGLTRQQLIAANPRLLAFMAHDRVTLAGTMISIGILYTALAWFGIRHGAHWAHVAVIASAGTGMLSFFLFLAFGYFDPFHAFVTAVLTQFLLMCMTMQPSPPSPGVAEWRETAAWRRGQWGQLLFVLIAIALTGAGLVIALIGATSVFVETDLEFMRTTAARLHGAHHGLVPLVAHDRASVGGMLIANGVVVGLSALWGFRAGSRWLWLALALAGNVAFACAIAVHLVVGYHSPLHLAPAVIGWMIWNVALALCRRWLSSF